jgi:hypothetical protein
MREMKEGDEGGIRSRNKRGMRREEGMREMKEGDEGGMRGARDER